MKLQKTEAVKNFFFFYWKINTWINFNPGLALTGFRSVKGKAWGNNRSVFLMYVPLILFHF